MKKASIKIAIMGESHAKWSWRNRLEDWFKMFYNTVTVQVFARGGETIQDGMPLDHPTTPGTVDKSITSVLAFNPDVIFLFYAGNHFANGFSLQSVKDMYTYLADYIAARNMPFIFSTAGPRGTFFPGSNIDAYRDMSLAFNEWLNASYPNNVYNIWDPLTNPATQLPKAELLEADALHYNVAGHKVIFEAAISAIPFYKQLIGFDNGAVRKILGKQYLDYFTGKDFKRYIS